MQNFNAKNFFLCSLSVSMIFSCCVAGYLIFKNEQDKVQFEKGKLEKRQKMDKTYRLEFRSTHMVGLLNPNQPSTYSWYSERLKEIKSEMRQDGYDTCEIEEMSSQEFNKALDQCGLLKNK